MPSTHSFPCARCGRPYETAVTEEWIDGEWVALRRHVFCSAECTRAFAEMTGQPWNGERK
ncbi:MAG: hypothetical protein QXH27_03750 [Candidatus Micrarchaeia archaeon]